MCSRGVFQLQKLSLFFCDYGGSSSGVRDLITSNNFKNFMASNPHIQLEVICKRNHHPHVKGTYLNGYQKSVPLRSYDEKNSLEVLESLRNQLGRKALKVNGPRVFSTKKSIQGKWQPNLFNKYPVVQLSKTYQIPDVPDEKVQKEKPQRNLRKQDVANYTMKVRPFLDVHSDKA